MGVISGIIRSVHTRPSLNRPSLIPRVPLHHVISAERGNQREDTTTHQELETQTRNVGSWSLLLQPSEERRRSQEQEQEEENAIPQYASSQSPSRIGRRSGYRGRTTESSPPHTQAPHQTPRLGH